MLGTKPAKPSHSTSKNFATVLQHWIYMKKNTIKQYFSVTTHFAVTKYADDYE